jgi:hypothetical protein
MLSRKEKSMRKIVVVCILCLVPALSGICQSQLVGIKGDEPLFGTWVNEKYDKDASGRSGTGKSIILPDGHSFDYAHIADNLPAYENWFVVEKTWVDEQGRHWYRMKTITTAYGSKGSKTEGYGLTRVSADRSTIEGVWAQYGYPEDVWPLGPMYGIQYRQK